MYVCVCVQISSLKPLCQLKPNFMWNLHGIGEKVYSNGPGHLLFFIIVNLRGAGVFNRDFTINLSPQCQVFNRALKTEKLKAPLFPGRDYKWLVHNQDSYKISEDFEFRPDWTIHVGVTYPWVPKNVIFDLVRSIAFLVLIISLWDLQIIWTGIKPRMNLNSRQIGLLALELLAL